MSALHPDLEQFTAAAAHRRLLPVWRELLCDADTPVGAYAKLRELDPCTFLLESVVGGMRWARYSFVGVGARARVTGWWRGGRLTVELAPGDGFAAPDLRDAEGRPAEGLEVVRALLRHYTGPPVPGLPRFWGGLVGVWGHDLVRTVEDLPAPAHGEDADLPAFELLLTDTLVIFDNLSLTATVVSAAVPELDGGPAQAHAAAQTRIARVVDALEGTGRPHPLAIVDGVEAEPRVADGWRAGRPYPAQVEATKRYIESGDVFQLVLSQRFDAEARDTDMLDVYRVLRVTNPAPYMYLLELPSGTLAGASPEVLVRVDRVEGVEAGDDGGDHRRVTVRPIAGTRRRGRDEAEDRALEAELLADPKERAEHLMLIDLGRNDVGRVARAGTVRMEESFVIERYSRVMHIVSEVSGELLPELSALDALLASFPAGTLSGAPKVRALELIDELEPAPRGWYGGAVGYLGFDGGADFAICIRSVVAKDGHLRTQAGAGIVFDSVPEAEDDECHRKASAVLAAIEMARAAGEARTR